MSARPQKTERRHARSPDTLVSLCRLLDAARREAGLSALALADASGCLVAGSGPARLCDELAALSTLGAASASLQGLELGGQTPALRQLTLGSVELSLAALGGVRSRAGLPPGLGEGCQRILSERSSGHVAAP